MMMRRSLFTRRQVDSSCVWCACTWRARTWVFSVYLSRTSSLYALCICVPHGLLFPVSKRVSCRVVDHVSVVTFLGCDYCVVTLAPSPWTLCVGMHVLCYFAGNIFVMQSLYIKSYMIKIRFLQVFGFVKSRSFSCLVSSTVR